MRVVVYSLGSLVCRHASCEVNDHRCLLTRNSKSLLVFLGHVSTRPAIRGRPLSATRAVLLLFAEELADGHERVKRLALGDHRGAPVVANRAAVSLGLGGRVAAAARTDVAAAPAA